MNTYVFASLFFVFAVICWLRPISTNIAINIKTTEGYSRKKRLRNMYATIWYK